jgi:hypothetical protein
MITHKSIGYSGRLGNQMFQYAALKAIALKNKYDYALPNHLKIKSDGLFDLTNQKWIEYKLDLFDGFELKCNIIDELPLNEYVEKSFTFDFDVFNINDNTSIEGYYQSYKYFEEYKNEIKKDFTFKSEVYSKCFDIISQYNNSVSVHIRRGDYVNHPNYLVVTPEYIQSALNQFNDKEYTFLIFSDDIEWCKQVFPDEVIFIEGNNQYEDLCLMSLCDHNIIANSTFSWWGAFLNQNPNKKVIAPKNWYTESKPLYDLYPSKWIQI